MAQTEKNVDGAAWLAVLLEARQRGDDKAAERAERELSRIGVTVRLDRPAPKGKEADHAK